MESLTSVFASATSVSDVSYFPLIVAIVSLFVIAFFINSLVALVNVSRSLIYFFPVLIGVSIAWLYGQDILHITSHVLIVIGGCVLIGFVILLSLAKTDHIPLGFDGDVCGIESKTRRNVYFVISLALIAVTWWMSLTKCTQAPHIAFSLIFTILATICVLLDPTVLNANDDMFTDGSRIALKHRIFLFACIITPLIWYWISSQSITTAIDSITNTPDVTQTTDTKYVLDISNSCSGGVALLWTFSMWFGAIGTSPLTLFGIVE
eukprot:c5311_g1_i2.p1 GENE.c5311_g1_i2~~c5311_g1_i2.p1  ORF type:complete len:264 (+),score=45.51 c5311_g1_i2:51-842(+)